MSFVFVTEDEDELLDLSDLIETKTTDTGLTFEDDIPPPRKITDPDVQAKTRRGRQNRSTKSKGFDGKVEDGWSYYCANKSHLGLLCRSKYDGTCSCPCHMHTSYTENQLSYIEHYHPTLGWLYIEGDAPASYKGAYKVVISKSNGVKHRVPERELFENEEEADKATEPIEFEFVSGGNEQKFIFLSD